MERQLDCLKAAAEMPSVDAATCLPGDVSFKVETVAVR